jgi:pimeloyl-ACP methyl ester carboxylesterase
MMWGGESLSSLLCLYYAVLSHARSALHLARWLGPWTSDSSLPSGVIRTELTIPSSDVATRTMQAWLYRPQGHQHRGAYLLAPGLHYAGPADPRMDRFCKVLASAGYVVLAPFLPDFMELRVRSSLTDDLARCLQLLLDTPDWTAGRPPAIFSISFGGLPAIRLAADPDFRERIARLFLFGGYSDWSRTIEYCLTGNINGVSHRPRDPLNQPVVFMNLVDQLEGVPEDRATLVAAWRRYVEATWGRPEMKQPERYRPLASAAADQLDPELAFYFRLGCGLERGAYERCKAALDSPSIGRLLDPTPAMPEVRCPVTIVHGIDDDVIPYTESEALFQRFRETTETELHLTGLIDHTRSVAKLGAGLGELKILRDICMRLASRW